MLVLHREFEAILGKDKRFESFTTIGRSITLKTMNMIVSSSDSTFM